MKQVEPGNRHAEGPGFGLYLHWPFCAAKCPYCDFNSHVARDIDQARWVKAFKTEIARVGALTAGRKLDSIFFGGGTPSLMPPGTVQAILEAAQQTWSFSEHIEITLEANPTSVETHRLGEFLSAGINRFSIGVQALNDADLTRLGRLHTAREALEAVDMALALTERVNFDLIYARQHQSVADWREELQKALAKKPGHLSLYQLTIEDGTAFGVRHRAGKLKGLPGQDLSAELYEITQELCDAAGLPAYEVSNHARPGNESRHNLIYWRYGDYLGIGPGAHGRLSSGAARHATQGEKLPALWLAGVEAGAGEHETWEALAAADQGAEYAMMAMRLAEGMSLRRYRQLAGHHIPDDRIDPLIRDGLIWRTEDAVGTTQQGRLLLNSVLRELL